MTAAIVVAKRSGWQRLVEEAADPHVLALLAANDPSVARMRSAHDEHARAVDETLEALARASIGVLRLEAPGAPFAEDGADLIVTIGGDGTLLAASHHAFRAPILGVNSAPAHSIGFFCGARPGTIDAALARLAAGDLPRVTLTRMTVLKNGEVVSRRVLNDALVCHVSPAATSRYQLEHRGRIEEQRSSGLWIGPAAGSTAAQRSAGGEVLPLDADTLQLVVREPYTPEGRPLALRRIVIASGDRLLVRSKMLDARLFLDGPSETAPIALGDVLDFSRSDEPLVVLGLSASRHRFSG